MSRPTRGPVLLLLGVGLLLAVVGVAGIYAGLALAERIYALLPPITADADAIGGAAIAIGGAAFLAASLHLVAALLLARSAPMPPELVLVSVIALCAVMCLLAIGWAVAAFVSGASGSAPAEAMLPAGTGLTLLGAAYGWAAVALLRLRSRPGSPI